MALWGRREPATAGGVVSNGSGRPATGLEQHEWRSSNWQGQNAPAGRRSEPVLPMPLPEPPPEEDLVLTTEIHDAPAPPAEHEPEPVAAQAPPPAPEPEPEPVAAAPAPVAAPAPEPVERTDDTGRSQFFAGRGVKLKAEVSGCDIFRVEGDFDGTVTARRMFISPTGVFKGTGTVEEAEVEGRVDGTLTVTGVLVVKASGRVSGSVSYGQIEIERGGHLHGDVAPKAAPAAERPNSSATLRGQEPIRVSTPKPLIAATPIAAPAIEPTPLGPSAPRKTILPPLSFGAKKSN